MQCGLSSRRKVDLQVDWGELSSVFNLFLEALAYNDVLDERQGCLNSLQPDDVAVIVLQIGRH